MKIVKVTKEFKPNIEGDQTEKQKDTLYGDSLNSLNSMSNNYSYDFGSNHKQKEEVMVLKNEIKIVKSFMSTLMKILLKCLFVFGAIFLIYKISGLDFVFFCRKRIY